MNLYQVEIPIHATAYIKANSPEEALAKARELKDGSPDIPGSDGDVPISGRQYDDPDLPEISFSPAMTIGEISHDHAELAEKDIPE